MNKPFFLVNKDNITKNIYAINEVLKRHAFGSMVSKAYNSIAIIPTKDELETNHQILRSLTIDESDEPTALAEFSSDLGGLGPEFEFYLCEGQKIFIDGDKIYIEEIAEPVSGKGKPNRVVTLIEPNPNPLLPEEQEEMSHGADFDGQRNEVSGG